MVYTFLKLIKRIVVIYLIIKPKKKKKKCDANISVLHNNIHAN